jgi:hypothetical protein
MKASQMIIEQPKHGSTPTQSANGHNLPASHLTVSPHHTSAPATLTFPTTLHSQARELLPPTFPAYSWYSKTNFERALDSYYALQNALQSSRKYLISFDAGAIVSLYHKDRAEHAGSIVPEHPKPILEIPKEIVKKKSYPLSDEVYALQLSKTNNWVNGIPFERVSILARIGQTEPPDGFYLAKYIRYVTPLPDPILYAKYGDWYLKVAEWE